MEYSFIDFVEAAVPEGDQDVFLRAHRLLEQIGSTDHLVALDSVLALSGDLETISVIGRVEEVLCDALINQITEYGIGISERNIHLLPDVLMGLHDILEYPEYERILELCSDSTDPQETFCEILELLYGNDAVGYQYVIEYVNDNIIDRIVQHLEQRRILNDIDSSDPVLNQREALQQWVYSNPNTRISALLQRGFVLGHPIDHYLKEMILEGDTGHQMAIDYASAALASGMSLYDAIESVETHLSDYVKDTYAMRQVVEYLRSQLNKV